VQDDDAVAELALPDENRPARHLDVAGVRADREDRARWLLRDLALGAANRQRDRGGACGAESGDRGHENRATRPPGVFFNDYPRDK
jgi:hypothetical protein